MTAPPVLLLGDRRRPLQDLYHGLLTRPWRVTLGVIAGGAVVINVVFALAYWLAGGVSHAHGLADDFYFSVQTAGTIGYGGMTPAGTPANVLVVVESVVSLLATALATGLVFAKFSRSTARIRFAAHPTISPYDGRPTLRLRVGNERGNSSIVEARFRIVFSRTYVTAEGEKVYPQTDLALVRDHAPALSRAWTIMHTIDAQSPLHGATAASLAEVEAELFVSVTGVDETTAQTVHARIMYDAADVAFGVRPEDILSERPDGTFIVDLGKFDGLTPVAARAA
ncbi:MAG TPA: ion channel [Kofleriaceae bacterium]|nr:ion channel [Kofleriaceae bacterium]